MELPQLYVQVFEVCNLPRSCSKGGLCCELGMDQFLLRGSLTKNWVWQDEEFVFHVKNHSSTLSVSVYFYSSENPSSEDKGYFVGKVKIPMSYLADEEVKNQWFTLRSEGENSKEKPINSQIKLCLQYTFSKGTNLGALLMLKEREEFIQMLLQPGSAVPVALCVSIDISEAQKVSSALVNLFEYYKKFPDLLKEVILKEVEGTKSSSILFRANSMAMRMLSIYSRLIAQQYLEDTLSSIIREICADSRSVELDPSKLKPTDKLNENKLHLQSITDNLLQRILDSIDQCPVEIRQLCHLIKEIVIKRFPDSWQKAIGGFIFLRFFCPAIVAPDGYHIISDPPSSESRRALVLVTKTLQNLANGLYFGEKEEYMENLNEFIKSKLEVVTSYFEKLANLDSNLPATETDSSISIPAITVLEEITVIHSYLKKFIDKIEKNIPSNLKPPNFREVINKFKPPSKTEVKKLHSISNEQLLKRGALQIHKLDNEEKKGIKNSLDLLGLVRLGQFISETGVTLNQSEGEASTPPNNNINFCTLSGELLCVLFSLYMKHSYHSREGKFITNWSEIAASSEYKKFLNNCRNLQYTNLHALSRSETITFFVNIYATLAIHIHIVAGPPGSMKTLNPFFSSWYYNIGGDTYSLNIIKHGILRGNAKNGPSRMIQPADRKIQFVISDPDPRIHFALSYLSVSSPHIHIYSPETLEEDLQRAGILYCQEHVEINVSKREVVLPEIFSKYASDFGKTRDEIMIWLFQFLEDKRRIEILPLMKKGCHIVYKANIWAPQVPLENSMNLMSLAGKRETLKITNFSSSIFSVSPTPSPISSNPPTQTPTSSIPPTLSNPNVKSISNSNSKATSSSTIEPTSPQSPRRGTSGQEIRNPYRESIDKISPDSVAIYDVFYNDPLIHTTSSKNINQAVSPVVHRKTVSGERPTNLTKSKEDTSISIKSELKKDESSPSINRDNSSIIPSSNNNNNNLPSSSSNNNTNVSTNSTSNAPSTNNNISSNSPIHRNNSTISSSSISSTNNNNSASLNRNNSTISSFTNNNNNNNNLSINRNNSSMNFSSNSSGHTANSSTHSISSDPSTKARAIYNALLSAYERMMSNLADLESKSPQFSKEQVLLAHQIISFIQIEINSSFQSPPFAPNLISLGDDISGAQLFSIKSYVMNNFISMREDFKKLHSEIIQAEGNLEKLTHLGQKVREIRAALNTGKTEQTILKNLIQEAKQKS